MSVHLNKSNKGNPFKKNNTMSEKKNNKKERMEKSFVLSLFIIIISVFKSKVLMFKG